MKYPPSSTPTWWSVVEARLACRQGGEERLASAAWLFESPLGDDVQKEVLPIVTGQDPYGTIFQLIERTRSLDVWPVTLLDLVIAGNAVRWGEVPARDSKLGIRTRLSLRERQTVFARVVTAAETAPVALPNEALGYFATCALAAGFATHGKTRQRFLRLSGLLTDETLAKVPGWIVDCGAPLADIWIVVAALRGRGVKVPPRSWPRDLFTGSWAKASVLFHLIHSAGDFPEDLLAAGKLCGATSSYPDLGNAMSTDRAVQILLSRLLALPALAGKENEWAEFATVHASALECVGVNVAIDRSCRDLVERISRELEDHRRSAGMLILCAVSSLRDPGRFRDQIYPVLERLARIPGARLDAIDPIKERLGIIGGVSPLLRAVDRFLTAQSKLPLVSAEFAQLVTSYRRPDIRKLLEDSLQLGVEGQQTRAILVIARLVREADISPELAHLAAAAQRVFARQPALFEDAAWELDRALRARCRCLDGRRLAKMVADRHVAAGTPAHVARAMQSLLERGPQERLLHVLFLVDSAQIRRVSDSEIASLLDQSTLQADPSKAVRVMEVVGWGRGAASLSRIDEIVVTEIPAGQSSPLNSACAPSTSDAYFQVRQAGQQVSLSLFEAQFLRRRYNLTATCEALIRQRVLAPYDAGSEKRQKDALFLASQADVASLFKHTKTENLFNSVGQHGETPDI